MSVYVEDAPKVDPEIFELGVPVLGICYGAQAIALELGGSVARTGAQRVRQDHAQRHQAGAHPRGHCAAKSSAG